MPHQATVTAKTGPDRQLTGVLIPGVLGVEFDLVGKRLFLTVEQTSGDNIREFDLSSVTTVTFTITGGNYAVVVA